MADTFGSYESNDGGSAGTGEPEANGHAAVADESETRPFDAAATADVAGCRSRTLPRRSGDRRRRDRRSDRDRSRRRSHRRRDRSSAEDLGDAELIDVEEVAPSRAAESPFDRSGRWYVVHTYAGYENKVKSNLASRVRSMAVEDRIFEVVIPMEDVIEFKNGRKVVVQKKVFPGYLLVRMGLDDDAWYVVRNTPGVTGFVGSGAKPTPLSRREVEDILGTGVKEEGAVVEKKVRPRLEYDIDEQVRVVTGPFADFNGVISEIDVDRSKLKVLVNIFGRETPVELEFADVAKL